MPLAVAGAVLCATLGTAARAQSTSLPPVVAEALRANRIPQDAVSMLVMPVEAAGRARLDHLGQLPRQPASVMKLFTTGVALTTLGPAFTWRTDVALGGALTPDGRLLGPLYLRGSGDPSLVLENVWLMMSRWRAAGLQDIQGGIVVDRSAFDAPAHDPAAFDDSPLKPYNAGPDALLLNHQAVTLRFMPDAARPGGVRVTMEPALDGVTLDARLSLRQDVACGAWREGLSLSMRPTLPLMHNDTGPNGGTAIAPLASITGETARGGQAAGTSSWTLSVRGLYPAGCQTRDWPLLWQGEGAGDHAARLLRQVWRDLDGRLGPAPPAGAVVATTSASARPAIRAGAWPSDAVVWQSWSSPPLLQVVQDINKFSNNVMARQLFLGLAPLPAPATLDKAREAVSAQVRAATRDATGRSPCDGENLVLDNGSGLSRLERGSAWCLGRWLQAMWASPVMPEFLSSLPIAGLDGTARRLDAASGRAHVKTGSLEGVSAIAGVVLGDSGRRYVVVGIVNHPQAGGARPALDALLGWTMRDGEVPGP